MSRINILCASQIELFEWRKTNQDNVQEHDAWHEDINAIQAEALLQGKEPGTYLLRSDEKEYSYFITFIGEDNSIKHQPFTLESDSRVWYFKNGVATKKSTEIISKDLHELISAMMHCKPAQCKALLQNAMT